MPELRLIAAFALASCGGTSPAAEPAAGGEPARAGDSHERAGEEPGPQEPAQEEAACEWRLEEGALVHPSIADLGDPPEPREVDLDGEPPADLVANVGACGNWGDCFHVVLRACERGGYQPVWGPEYAQAIEIGARPEGASLADLRLFGRIGQAGCDLPLRTVLSWTPGGWERGESCTPAPGATSWNRQACGEPPPRCED